jgi:hypothetical protein
MANSNLNRIKTAFQQEADDRSQNYQHGCKVGEDWARDSATPKALQKLFDRYRIIRDLRVGTKLETAHDVYEAMFGKRRREVDGLPSVSDQEVVREFWDKLIGNGRGLGDANDPEFVRGFVEAAVKFWEDLMDEFKAAAEADVDCDLE